MARDISELGADVIDDSPKQEHRISPKKRNYIIGLSVAGVLLAGAVVASAIAVNTVLLDYSNLSDITYYYTPKSMLPEGETTPTAVLYKLRSDVSYPSTFRIPSKIKGYKVVGIAPEAFIGHEEIKKVIMPSSLQYVGERAFLDCTNLKSFTWSKNLTDVGVDAFSGTKFYEDLLSQTDKLEVLPSGLLVYAGKDVFKANTALFSDEISDSEIQSIKSKYGIAETLRFGTLNVKNICSGAFKGNDKITYIDLPSQLDEIANSTFENCYNLKGIDSEHCKLTEIGARAFANCSMLSDIKLPNNLTKLGDYAFSNTALVDTIPDVSNVSSLGEGIFAYCESLTSVVFEGLELPNYTFEGCSSLTSFSWGEDNENIDSVTYIGIGAFEGTGFSSFVIPKEVLEINDETFKDCENLESISLWGNFNYKTIEIEPDEGEESASETTDEENTFIKYDGTTGNGFLDGINSIKASAFDGCKSLSSIKLFNDDYSLHPDYSEDGVFNFPASLITTDSKSTIAGAENRIFADNNEQLVKITPNLRTIGSYAFFGNKTLKNVTVSYPEQSRLVAIMENAFQNCTALEGINLPNSLKTLSASVFRGCSELKEVGLGNTQVVSISSGTFYDCPKLDNLELPQKVTSIKTDAFYNNLSLSKLVIPASLTEIQNNAFMQCREPDSEELPLYFMFTRDSFKSVNVPKRGVWHDDTVKIYFLLGEGEEKEEGYNYWNGDPTNPQVI